MRSAKRDADEKLLWRLMSSERAKTSLKYSHRTSKWTVGGESLIYLYIRKIQKYATINVLQDSKYIFSILIYLVKYEKMYLVRREHVTNCD